MLVSVLVAIIIFLGVIDAAVLAAVLLHHWHSARSRAKREVAKHEWKELLLKGDVLIEPLPGADTLRPAQRAVMGEALRELMGAGSPMDPKVASAIFDQLGLTDFYSLRLKSRLWWHRGEAALALGEAGKIETTAPMAELLNDPFVSVRLKAATGLALLGSAESIDILAGHLDALGPVTLQWLKDLFVLVLKDKPDAVADLLDRNFPMLVTKAIIETVGDIPGFGRPDALAKFLTDEDSDEELRISAVKTLGRLGSEEPAIEDQLDASSWEMRAAAAKALGEARSTKSIPRLEESLADSSWWVRVNSAHALANLGDDGAAALRRGLTAADRFARDIARQTLAEIAMTGEEEELARD